MYDTIYIVYIIIYAFSGSLDAKFWNKDEVQASYMHSQDWGSNQTQT